MEQRDEQEVTASSQAASSEVVRDWEYAAVGDYHRSIDPNWSYAPTYFQKMRLIDEIMLTIPKNAKVLDVGCGEGVLVERYRALGYDIQGVDANYESEIVTRAVVTSLPFANQHFDVVMLLDVFEHVPVSDQPRALDEVHRVLKSSGIFLASIPNLAHWNSRWRMFFRGEVDRTDIIENHVGERPHAENRRCLERSGFTIDSCRGVTLTVPYIYRRLICRHAARLRWLHDLFEPLARRLPQLSFMALFVCRKSAD